MSRSLLIDFSPFSIQFVEKPLAYDTKVALKTVPAESTQKINSIYRQIKEACSSAVQAATEGARRFKSGYVLGLKGVVVNLGLVILKNALFPDFLSKKETDPERAKAVSQATENYSAFALQFTPVVVIAPIVEELLFRGLCQDLILFRLPRRLIKKIAPGKEVMLDSKIAKAVRIGIVALGFGLVHIMNGHKDRYKQAFHATLVGIFFGAIKESKLGIVGSIAAHMGNNSVGWFLLNLNSKVHNHQAHGHK